MTEQKQMLGYTKEQIQEIVNLLKPIPLEIGYRVQEILLREVMSINVTIQETPKTDEVITPAEAPKPTKPKKGAK